MPWVVALMTGWLVCFLICTRMGRETGRDGRAFGILGPLGIVLLAVLPSRAPPSAAVQRLERKGLVGPRVRRATLRPVGRNIASLQDGSRRQIHEDVGGGDEAPDEAATSD